MTTNLRRCAAPAIVTLCAALGCAAPGRMEVRGLLVGKGLASENAKARELDFVSGLAASYDWGRLEPVRGAFAWEPLDADVAWAREHGRLLSLVVKAGEATPPWVYEAGAATIAFADPELPFPARMPVPWDGVFLAEWVRFIGALGARYGREPSVAIVQVSGLGKNRGAMHLPHEPVDRESLAKAGYSPERWLAAWRRVIEATAAAFPRARIRIALSRHIFDPDVAPAVVEAALACAPGRVDIVVNHVVPTWSLFEPEHAIVVESLRRKFGDRATWGAELAGRGVTDVGRALEVARKLGAAYVEIHADMLVRPDLADIFRRNAGFPR